METDQRWKKALNIKITIIWVLTRLVMDLVEAMKLQWNNIQITCINPINERPVMVVVQQDFLGLKHGLDKQCRRAC